MMNLEAEKIQLIDISSEDDFLIDSQLDRPSLDLRLSVACETENELVCSVEHSKPRACSEANDAVPLCSSQEPETFKPARENIDNDCSLRNSMTWDSAFFTSPGFLELEELCLVNRGFQNHEPVSSRGTQENAQSKICLERNTSHKPGVKTTSRQRTLPLVKPKLATPNKVISTQDSKPKNMPKGTSAVPRVVSKPQVVTILSPQHLPRRSSAVPKADCRPHVAQSTTDRKESLKSSRTASLPRVATTQTKRSPLTVKSGEFPAAERLGASKTRRPKTWSIGSSVSSSQSALSSLCSSVDLSPYRNCSDDPAKSANLMKSPVIQGDIAATPRASPRSMLSFDVKESQNSENNQHFHRSPMELRQGSLRQSAPTRSPVLSDTQQSPKPSSLRVPSQKLGFFDMKSDARASSNSLRYSHCKENKPTRKPKDLKSKDDLQLQASTNQKGRKDQRRNNQHRQTFARQTVSSSLRIEEKENIFHPEDTVIELDIKHSSHSPSKPDVKTNGQYSSSTGKHLLKTRKPMQ